MTPMLPPVDLTTIDRRTLFGACAAGAMGLSASTATPSVAGPSVAGVELYESDDGERWSKVCDCEQIAPGVWAPTALSRARYVRMTATAAD